MSSTVELEELGPPLSASPAREAASAYAARTAATPLPPDEFLNWFISVRGGPAALPADRPQPARRRRRLPPQLPGPDAIETVVRSWIHADPSLAASRAAGAPLASALAHWAGRLLQDGEPSGALEAFRVVAALDPAVPINWVNLGVAYDVCGALAESGACLEHALDLDSQQPDAWLQLGLVRRKQRDPAEAEFAFRAALQQQPANSLAWQCLGLLKEEQEDYPAAIDCFIACLINGGVSAALCANTGRLCYRIGRLIPAHNAYQDAVQLEPGNERFRGMERKLRFLRETLEGRTIDEAGALVGASDEELRELCEKTFGILAGFGHTAAAARVARRSLERWPEQPATAYLLRALEGDPELRRSPSEYVREHFDRFADSFDSQLVGALGYDVPEKIERLLARELGEKRLGDVLDAGCGTGLCGEFLRARAARLTGIDLSPRMLEHARRRGCYDAAQVDDLIQFLGRSPRRFDLMVAADVLIYFGDLAPLLSSAAYSLRRGGWLAFTTEAHDGCGYRLRASGRFAHAPEYVRQTAEPEFDLVSVEATTLRQEGTVRVPGHLFLFRRL